MKFGIAFKLGCLLAVFGVLACGLTGYYSYSSSRATLLKAAERDLLTATQVLGRNLRGNIDGVSRDALMLAGIAQGKALPQAPSAPVREQAEKDLAELFRTLMRVHPEYMQIRLISAAGHGLEQVRVDRDGNQPVQITYPGLQEKGHFDYVFDTLRLPPGQVRLSPIVINHELGTHSGVGRPTLHVSTPVAGANSQPGSLIVINIDLNQLFDQLRSDLPSHYQVYLGNRWGDLLIHPDQRRAFGFDQGRRYFMQDEFPDVQRLLAAETESLIGRSEGENTGLVAAFVRLTTNPGNAESFVVLGLAQPEANVLKESNRLGERIIQVVIFASLLAVLIATIASRALTRSLKRINLAVQQFARERRSAPLPVQRQDELGQLARSFVQMQEEIVEHLEELSRSRNALEHLARHDPLTGLPNRRVFFERLEHALATARRNAKPLAVLFVDLDHFKQLNDSLGHSVGDRVLQAVANLLRSATRESDTVARLGGDEFVILIEQLDDPSRVVAVLHKLHERFQLPMLLDGHEIKVQASMGVSLFPRDGDDIESLVQQADRAMYAAKNAGRNTYSYESNEQH
ncbi:diguanylate cyclase domain-containing protein [Aquipseudomonas alcaligenes]|uniref:Diguanylate cyclase n=1 Tax=Aquipseudomonas alcaligenes TaxID=43263 RepID=A0AB73HYS4_AQUAC|nr:diguanylate cyclase [Pseudomonas alcaligenes]MDH0143019.1 diguanylate cyclase [Pseudomonas alcaligenes]